MTGIVIGIVVLTGIGMFHYQVTIAPMVDKHGHIINEEKGGE